MALVKTTGADEKRVAEVVAGAADTTGSGLKLGLGDVLGTELYW